MLPGVITPDTPIDLTILSGVLSGADEFNGTAVKGRNPVLGSFDFTIFRLKWRFGFTPDNPDVLLDLPSAFINGTDVALRGEIDAATLNPVPEPVSVISLGIGILIMLGYRQRGKHSKRFL